MKKSSSILTIMVILILGAISIYSYSVYRTISLNDKKVKETWQQVEKFKNIAVDNKYKEKINLKYDAIEIYNKSVEEYNISVRRIPNKLFAKLFNFEIKKYYIAKADG